MSEVGHLCATDATRRELLILDSAEQARQLARALMAAADDYDRMT